MARVLTQTEPKTTVAAALQDALELLQRSTADRTPLTVDDFTLQMETRGIELGTAQDTLRFLRGTGEFVIDEAGYVHAAPRPDAR